MAAAAGLLDLNEPMFGLSKVEVVQSIDPTKLQATLKWIIDEVQAQKAAKDGQQDPAQLAKQVAQLQEQIMKAASDQEEMRQQLAKAAQQAADAAAAAEALQDKLKDSEAVRGQLDTLQKESRAELGKHAGNLEALQASLSALGGGPGDLRARLDTLAKEVVELQHRKGGGAAAGADTGVLAARLAALETSEHQIRDTLDGLADKVEAAQTGRLIQQQRALEQAVAELRAAEGDLRRLVGDKPSHADVAQLLAAQAAPATLQVPTGAPADSAALTAAINSQAGKLAALESQVALAQQRLADKADAGATGALRADVDRMMQSVGDAGVDAARGSLTTRLSAVERGVGQSSMPGMRRTTSSTAAATAALAARLAAVETQLAGLQQAQAAIDAGVAAAGAGGARPASAFTPVRPGRRSTLDLQGSSELQTVKGELQHLKDAVAVLANATHLMALPQPGSRPASAPRSGRRLSTPPSLPGNLTAGLGSAPGAVLLDSIAEGAAHPGDKWGSAALAGGSPADFLVLEGQERGASGLQAPADASAPVWGGQQPGRPNAPPAGDRSAAGSRSAAGAAMTVPSTDSAVLSDVAGGSGRAAGGAGGIGAGVGVSNGSMQSMSGSDAWGSGGGTRGAAPAGSSGGAGAGAGAGSGAGVSAGAGAGAGSGAGAGAGAGSGAGAGARSGAGQRSAALGAVAVAEDGLGPAALRRAAYGPAMGAGPTAAEQQGTAGTPTGPTLFEQPYIGAPLRDLVNQMHGGNLGHKMDDTDVHDMMSSRIGALEAALAQVKQLLLQQQGQGAGKNYDALLKQLRTELGGLKKKVAALASLQIQSDGDHAMLSGKALQGYRCMACDRPLAKLEMDMGPYIPAQYMHLHQHHADPAKAGGGGVIGSGNRESNSRASPRKPAPPVAEASRVSMVAQDDAHGPQHWYPDAHGRPAEGLPREDVGPHLPPGGWRAGTSQGSRPRTGLASSGGGSSRPHSPSNSLPNIHEKVPAAHR